jgi:hypothetical protein
MSVETRLIDVNVLPYKIVMIGQYLKGPPRGAPPKCLALLAKIRFVDSRIRRF